MQKIIDHLFFALKSISVFLILMVLHFMFGNLDTRDIAFIVFAVAVVILSAVFISAAVKDRIQRRRASSQTVFGS